MVRLASDRRLANSHEYTGVQAARTLHLGLLILSVAHVSLPQRLQFVRAFPPMSRSFSPLPSFNEPWMSCVDQVKVVAGTLPILNAFAL